MNTGRTAIIIGAGIGGLACGVALRRAGWTVRIYEQAAEARALGFGLGLAPNAVAALVELGVAESVFGTTSQISGVEIRRTNGRVLRRFNVPVGMPAAVALRPVLHGALLAGLGADAVRLDHQAMTFAHGSERVRVTFANGAVDQGDVLIGADGVMSAVRAWLHPAEPPPRESGFSAIRGVSYGVSANLGGLSGVAYLDDGVEAATVRASTDAVYWYVSLRTQEVRSPDVDSILDSLTQRFERSFNEIAAAAQPEDKRFDSLYLRTPLPAWGSGHVTLLGDAAHPMLPHTGQGAAQSLEDAVALALALTTVRDVRDALRLYETVRMRRTHKLIALGPRIAGITTTRNPVINAVRTAGIRLVPERLIAFAARRQGRDPHGPLRPSIARGRAG